MKSEQKDNTTLSRKIALRRAVLERIEAPIVMETHGGKGEVWRHCYRDLPIGAVVEKNPQKAELLTKQRPTWAVYEGDCVGSIAAGLGSHLPVNLLDVDPYGDPWPVIGAFFESDRPRPETVWVVVNDGLRQKVKLGGTIGSLQDVIEEFGRSLYANYLEVCRLLMERKAAQAGYRLGRWSGYYCGHCLAMTHYTACLTRNGLPTGW